MAKYYGKVGYTETTEKKIDGKGTGVWENVITEKYYYGDVIKTMSRWQNSGGVNDNINITNNISIVADAYAYNNFSKIIYVEWMGVKWKVSSIEVQRPRLILSIGGEYNG